MYFPKYFWLKVSRQVQKRKKMNRKLQLFLLVGFLFILEVTLFYNEYFYLNFLVKFLIGGLLIYFYRSQIQGDLITSDKLFFTASVFGFLGEIGFMYPKTEVLTSVLVFVYLVEHQLYISLLRQPGYLNKNLSNFDLLRKGWPFILTAFLFFGFFLMEIVPDSIFVLMIFYVFQFAILGAYSLTLSKGSKGKVFIILGVVLIAISDILSSWYLFLGEFKFAYIIIRGIYISSKFLLAYGFILNLKRNQTDNLNHWDMGDK